MLLSYSWCCLSYLSIFCNTWSNSTITWGRRRLIKRLNFLLYDYIHTYITTWGRCRLTWRSETMVMDGNFPLFVFYNYCFFSIVNYYWLLVLWLLPRIWTKVCTHMCTLNYTLSINNFCNRYFAFFSNVHGIKMKVPFICQAFSRCSSFSCPRIEVQTKPNMNSYGLVRYMVWL
jgi:hypothetical protein